MAFNAQEYMDGLEAPVYVDTKGRTHVGQILSQEEWLPHQEKMSRAVQESGEGGVDYATLRRMLRPFLDALFPEPWYKRYNPFYRTPTKDILNLPPMGMLRCVWDFIRSQGEHAGVEVETPPGMELPKDA